MKRNNRSSFSLFSISDLFQIFAWKLINYGVKWCLFFLWQGLLVLLKLCVMTSGSENFRFRWTWSTVLFWNFWYSPRLQIIQKIAIGNENQIEILHSNICEHEQYKNIRLEFFELNICFGKSRSLLNWRWRKTRI
jgi:hypothetical protein